MKTNHVYDNYEISGCRHLTEDGKDGRQFAESCDAADAEFWTLYGHITGQGAEAIGDFDSRQAAEEAYYRITGQRFTGSREVTERLRLMHAAPDLLAALTECATLIADYNAYRNAIAAIAKATTTCPPWEADESYSVLLLYPDYLDDTGYETYYAHVKAADPIEAAAVARQQVAAAWAEEGVEIEPDDFHPLLVTQGHHYSEPLFNK